MADIYIGNVKGPQGETGATGAQGPQGDAATIEVGTVSTTAYGNTAQVINTGTSSEAVFDFVIPQGRPGEETTRMSALTLDTVTAQSAEFPIPATGESGATVFGKIIKFFNDAKTAINSKINISDIVNNLTSTATNKPLSAAQGKALNDALTNSFGTIALASTQTNNLSIPRQYNILLNNKSVIVDTIISVATKPTATAILYFPSRSIAKNSDLVAINFTSGAEQMLYAQSSNSRIEINGSNNLAAGTWLILGNVELS